MNMPKVCKGWTELSQNLYKLPLPDVISIQVTENLNGSFDLEMKYPIQGENADLLSIDNIGGGYSPLVCVVPRKGANEEPFRIYETNKSLDGLMTVKAHHIVYDTDGIVIEPFSATGISAVVTALNTHWNNYGAQFVVQTDITNTTTVFNSKVPASLFSLIGAAATAFNAELSYEYDAFTSRVLIKLNAARGSVKTSVVGYGVNLVSATKKVNNDSVYNYGYVYAQQENDDGTVTVVSNYNTYPTFNGRSRAQIADVSSYYDGLPTAGDLLSDFWSFRLGGGQQQTATVDFVPLEDTTEGYGDSALGLGDTVKVNADPMGMTLTSKVVQTVYNPLTEKYDSMSVGSVENTIADTIVGIETQKKDQERLIATGFVEAESVAAGSTRTESISFGKTFGKNPMVVATLFSSQTTGLGQCSASVYNITTTGFSLRLTNGYSSARNLGATWIAT